MMSNFTVDDFQSSLCFLKFKKHRKFLMWSTVCWWKMKAMHPLVAAFHPFCYACLPTNKRPEYEAQAIAYQCLIPFFEI